MIQTKSMVLLAGAALGFSGVAAAQQNAAWSSANADEVRALVAEMMSDAETRSSLLQSGATAGHDGKFFLASGDGNFRLNIGGQIQFRYYLNFRDDDGFSGSPTDPDDPSPAGETDDFEPGFETRRTRLKFDGHVFDPNLFYYVQGDFSRRGGGFTLLDAYVGYKFSNGVTARWGQFKLPFLREELVSSSMQLAVDRSLTSSIFSQGRSQGIEVSYKGEMWKIAGAFSDGFGSANSAFGTEAADWALTGRVEFLLAGDWNQFKDFTSPQGSNFAALLGGALHWEEAADRPGFSGVDILTWTLDASLEGDSWNIFMSYTGRDLDFDSGGSLTDHAFMIQGGIYVTEQFEPFLRYDLFLTDSDRFTDDINSLTFGFNYYIHGHAAKFTMDVVWLFDPTIGGVSDGTDFFVFENFASSSLGILGSSADDEVVIRTQFQLLF